MADNNYTTTCEEPSEAATQLYNAVQWLFEDVFQTAIGIAGMLIKSGPSTSFLGSSIAYMLHENVF